MVLLTINLKVKAGRFEKLAANFQQKFLPTVSRQPGFSGARLARELETPRRALILLFFQTEQQRLDWVASPEHDPVWSTIADLCSHYTPVSHELVVGSSGER